MKAAVTDILEKNMLPGFDVVDMIDSCPIECDEDN